MSSKLPIDDILAGAGFVIFITGIYLLLGLAVALILLGLTLIYAGARLDIGKSHEPDQTTSSTITQIQPRQR